MSIQSDLASFGRRIRYLRAVQRANLGLLSSGFIGLCLIGLDYANLIALEWKVLASIWLAGPTFGAIAGYFAPLSDMEIAASIDLRAQLRDRLTSTLAVDRTNYFDALKEDALASLNGINPNRLFAFRLNGWYLASPISVTVCAVLFALSNGTISISKSKAEALKIAQIEAERVTRVSKPLLKDEGRMGHNAEELQYLEELEKYRKDLQRDKLTKEQAYDRLGELESSLSRQVEKNWDKFSKEGATAEQSLSKALADEYSRLNHTRPNEALENMLAETRSANLNSKAKAQELDKQISDKQREINDLKKSIQASSKTGQPSNEQQKKLEEAQKKLASLQMSKKYLDWLNRLQSMPEYKELLNQMAKMRNLQSQDAPKGQGSAQMSQKELEEMKRALDELAKKFESEEEMKKLIDQLKAALEHGRRAARAGLSMPGLPFMDSLMPGNDGTQHEGHFDQVSNPKLDKPQEFGKKGAELNVGNEVNNPDATGNEPYVEVRGPARLGLSRVKASSVLPKYAKAAERAVDTEQIPKARSETVRRYFDSLQGNK